MEHEGEQSVHSLVIVQDSSWCCDINTFVHDFQCCLDEDNLHYAALRKNKVTRSTRQRDNTSSECVYSSVRQRN